jgi:AbrB family looped-hinge helix DNA binding protein
VQEEDMAETTIVTTKGQIVIPARIRKKYKIGKGTRLFIEEKREEFVLRPINEEYYERIAGTLPTKGKLTKALLADRREEKKREER